MVVPKTITVTVTTAGTRVPLIAPTVAVTNSIVGISIQSVTAAATIYVGDVTVSATNGIALTTTSGTIFNLPLQAGKDAIDIQQIYIDASASGAKASVLYFLKTS